MNAFPHNSTVILVHGAWADGSCWRDVILPVERQGLRVICAQIPLTSLSDDVSALTRVVERTDGPVVLGGHAYGGAVIAGITEERVKSLVYVAALALKREKPSRRCFIATNLMRKLELVSRQARLNLDAGRRFQAAVAHKASSDQTRVLSAVQRPISVQCVQEKAPVPGWKSKPSGFLIAEEDRMINPRTQKFMAGRMGARIRSSRVDHSPMHTATDLVIDVISEAARESLSR
jgi:pimeloyl-ACP methyl ester carboxylesterase